MAKYRKKPVTIEAFLWTGGPCQEEDPEWICSAIERGVVTLEYPEMKIQTLEGVMTASKGDWIIQGVEGEIYPCKNNIFEKTYEREII